MPDQNQATTQQAPSDPWAVVAQTPAPQPSAQSAAPTDPWAVVSQKTVNSALSSEASQVAALPNSVHQAHDQTANAPMNMSLLGRNPVPVADRAAAALHNAKLALTGPDTAAAQGATPDLQTEGAGFSDIIHGNIRQGLSEVAAAETPHIIAGSTVEKLIQQVNPDFRGTATPEYQAAHPTINSVGDHPIVDVAQFIDKKKNPVQKAIAEAGQSLTNPNNVAVMISTGGLGLVDSPASLAMANKLISAGFSASAIGGAYAHLKDFKAAYDKGDSTEALYQLTHGVLSGSIAIAAARDAATKSPITTAGGKVLDKVNDVAGSAKDLAASTAGDAVGAAKDFVMGPDAETSAIRSIKPTAKAAEKFSTDFQKATPDLQEFDKTAPIKTVGDLKEAIPQIKEKIWDEEVAPAVARHGAANINMSSVKQAVLDSLTPEMREFEPESVESIEKFAETAGKARTVAQAENVLKYINGKLDGYFAKNPAAKGVDLLTNPDTAMWESARREIREQFLQTLDVLGEDGVRDARQRYGALSGIEGAVDTAAGRLAKTPGVSPYKIGLYKLLGGILGIGAAGAGSAGIGTAVGIGAIGADMLHKYNTNPDVLIRRAIKRGGESPKTVGDLIEPTHQLVGGKIVPLNQ
jgi:hypothetical protein